MLFNVTLKFENENNCFDKFGEIANFQIEGDYQKEILEMFEKREPVEVCLNNTVMGKYRITEVTSRIQEEG